MNSSTDIPTAEEISRMCSDLRAEVGYFPCRENSTIGNFSFTSVFKKGKIDM